VTTPRHSGIVAAAVLGTRRPHAQTVRTCAALSGPFCDLWSQVHKGIAQGPKPKKGQVLITSPRMTTRRPLLAEAVGCFGPVGTRAPSFRGQSILWSNSAALQKKRARRAGPALGGLSCAKAPQNKLEPFGLKPALPPCALRKGAKRGHMGLPQFPGGQRAWQWAKRGGPKVARAAGERTKLLGEL